MVKLVFVDMDGTFLDSSKAVTPENAAVATSSSNGFSYRFFSANIAFDPSGTTQYASLSERPLHASSICIASSNRMPYWRTIREANVRFFERVRDSIHRSNEAASPVTRNGSSPRFDSSHSALAQRTAPLASRTKVNDARSSS